MRSKGSETRAAVHPPRRQAQGRRLENLVQGLLKVRDGAVDVVQFVQAEQADAESLEIRRLITLQRHASSRLQPLAQEFFAVQNRPAADQQGVAAGLGGQGLDAAAQMATLVQQRIKPWSACGPR